MAQIKKIDVGELKEGQALNIAVDDPKTETLCCGLAEAKVYMRLLRSQSCDGHITETIIDPRNNVPYFVVRKD